MPRSLGVTNRFRQYLTLAAGPRVIAIPLAEASAKIRSGGPIDEPHDLDGPHWAGTIPIATRFTAAQPSPDLAEGITTPSEYLDLDGRELNPNTQ